MGFRFQKRLRLLPGVRLNLSKGGVSTSLGPRGADVNIGRDGITTNAGIPGTGLSYRQKVGGHGAKAGLLGVLAVIGGLGWWGFQHLGTIEKVVAPVAPSQAGAPSVPANTASTSTRFVHRNGSVLRDAAKTSGKTLKKESKGAPVTLLQDMSGGWSKVQDGAVTGYMRSSVLGTDPPG